MEKNFRHGKLVTIEKIRKASKKLRLTAQWLCQCDCGNKHIVNENQLYGRGIQSCGCLDYKNKKIYDKENYNDLMKEKINENIIINENECWLWQGSRHRQGYGNLSYKRVPSLAHRVSWMIYKGEIPEGIKVCHKCDVTRCVNPEHLFLGTQKDNVIDAAIKGKFNGRKFNKGPLKLNGNQVMEIRQLHIEGKTRKELEIKFNVSPTCIAKILTGRSWGVNWSEV